MTVLLLFGWYALNSIVPLFKYNLSRDDTTDWIIRGFGVVPGNSCCLFEVICKYGAKLVMVSRQTLKP